MSLPPIRPTRLALALVLVLGLAACGGGDDASSSGPTTAPTTQTDEDGTGDEVATTGGEAADGDDAAGGEPVADPYDGHTSEVYDGEAAWICRPDLDDDPCRDLDVTVIDAEGERTVEERAPAEEPPIDCFYVYPTVSGDPGTNSDLEVAPDDPEEQTVVAQAAQYARSCRLFAPAYRQVTLEGLAAGGFAEGGAVAYADVVDAWKTYVSQHNDGRGVILIGHSQGAGHLSRLIADEVDGVEGVQERLVAAHLFGTSVQVAEGEGVGGAFEDVPACTTAEDTGCVVSWSSYPATTPPAEGAIFGEAAGDGQRALCVDAVGLLGRERGSAVAPVSAPLVGGIGVEDVETRFVALPDAVEVGCETEGTYDYLAVGIDEDDPRPLDRLVEQRLGPTWGLHLVDMTVALDDLVALAAQQGEAHTTG